MNLYMEFFLLGINTNVLGTVHGNGSGDGNAPPALIESNFRDGIYKINGSAVTLGDVWEENLDWGGWTGYTITPGLGYVKQDGGAPNYLSSDNSSPALKHGLLGSTINLTDGFTALFEGSFVWAEQSASNGDPHTVNCQFGIQIANFPDFTAYRECNALTAYNRVDGNPDPDFDHFTAQYNDSNSVEVQDDQLGVPAGSAVFRIAMTMADGRIAYSLNGRPVQSSVVDAMSPAPTDIGMEYSLTTLHLSFISALEYVAFYPKFANDADLMTLTAP